jgi:hypothetical protein
MVGLIWFVQLVHYPLFAAVGEAEFLLYERGHTRRTTWVVAVLMPLEALTAAWLLVDPPADVDRAPIAVGFALVAAVWISTALWQAPIHGRLSTGFDRVLHRRLVASNWVRTAAWTARGGLVLAMVAGPLG